MEFYDIESLEYFQSYQMEMAFNLEILNKDS